tara:strand:- start:5430 stop:6320 length:891 start_codon:yes stop_codon:yes gene_type:complete
MSRRKTETPALPGQAGKGGVRKDSFSRRRVAVTTGGAILIVGLIVVGIYFLIKRNTASTGNPSSLSGNSTSAHAAGFCSCFSGVDMKTLAINISNMNVPVFPTGMKKNKNIVRLARCLAKQLVAATKSFKKADDRAGFDYDLTVSLLKQPCVKVFLKELFIQQDKTGDMGDERINAVNNRVKKALEILEDVEGGPHKELWAEWGELNTGEPWKSGDIDGKFLPIMTAARKANGGDKEIPVPGGFHDALVSPEKLDQFETQAGILRSLLGLSRRVKGPPLPPLDIDPGAFDAINRAF